MTLGPRSRCVLIEKKWGKPLVCNDGVTIAKEFALEDPVENLGAQMLREAAERTGDVVGDGTTTSTLLAHAMVAEGVPPPRGVVALARAKGVEMPIAEAVHRVLFDNQPPTAAITDLLGRAPTAESPHPPVPSPSPAGRGSG